MKIHCPRCGPVYGSATIDLSFHAILGDRGIERDDLFQQVIPQPQIYYTCSECHNVGLEEDGWDLPEPTQPKRAKSRIYKLLQEELDYLRQIY